jgi:hypothetical protein
MYGLMVRWSLAQAAPEVAQQLRDYVRDTSLQRFTGMPGLCFKTWRMVPGDWFEGTYVWDTPSARDEFLASFRPVADDAPGTRLIGSAPVAYELFEVVAVAEGGAGFHAGPGPGQ